MPLSTEKYGRLGKPAMDVLNTLADTADASGAVVKGDSVRNTLRELSVGLCKGLWYRLLCGFEDSRADLW